jgi:hypothetical protein
MDLVEHDLINKKENFHPWELVRLEIIEENVRKIAQQQKNQIVLIDIGCGDAFVISNLKKKFNFESFHAVDINFTAEQINQLKGEHPIIDFRTDLFSIPVDANKSYILLLNDVIEHIEKDQEFIVALKNNLIDKTESLSLFITVPAFNFVFSSHDIDLGHYRRYTLKSLLAYNQTLKMDISTKGYFFTSLLLIRLVQRLLTFKKPEATKGHIGISHWNHGKLFTFAFKSTLQIDYFITNLISKVGIRIPGLSTFAVFKK